MLLFGFAMVLIMIWKPRGLITTRDPSVRLDWPRRAALGRPATEPAKAPLARGGADERGGPHGRAPRCRGSETASRSNLAPVLSVEHLSMRFGGLVAIHDSPSARAAARSRH